MATNVAPGNILYSYGYIRRLRRLFLCILYTQCQCDKLSQALRAYCI